MSSLQGSMDYSKRMLEIAREELKMEQTRATGGRDLWPSSRRVTGRDTSRSISTWLSLRKDERTTMF